MKRIRSHEIDELANRIFKDSLPPAWVIRPQNPDYGIDYIVEIVEDTDLTGITFSVQLKGEESISVNRDKTHATYYLQKKHATYYVDKAAQPVFLVLADVTNKLAYWVFIQQYFLVNQQSKKWRNARSVAVKVPLKNALKDVAALQAAVNEATEYMAALRPSSVENALHAKKQRLESIDPRFNVQIDVINGVQKIALHPKEQVEGKLIVSGPPENVQSKLNDLIGRGLPTTFEPGEIAIEGSPLLAEAFKDGGTLSLERSIEGTVSLVAEDDAGQVLSILDGINGTATGGLTEVRFNGTLPSSPITVSIEVTKDGPATFQFGFTIKNWFGQPIPLLAHFDQIATFFRGLAQCSMLVATCWLRGNLFHKGKIGKEYLDQLRALAKVTLLLEDARHVCRLTGLSPRLCPLSTEDELSDAKLICNLFTKGEHRYGAAGSRLSLTLDRAGIGNLVQMPPSDDYPLTLKGWDLEKRSFYGESVQVGPLEYCFTHAKPSLSNQKLRDRLRRSKAANIKVEFVCLKGSECTVRRIPLDDLIPPTPPNASPAGDS